MIKDLETSKKAGAEIGYPFYYTANVDKTYDNGRGRPGGCFWYATHKRSYFNLWHSLRSLLQMFEVDRILKFQG